MTGRTSYEVAYSTPGTPVGGGYYPSGGAGGTANQYATPETEADPGTCGTATLGAALSTKNASALCAPDPAAPAAAAGVGTTTVITVTATDAATLLADGSGITRQPPGPEVLLTKDFI
ncbi:hypothetical protein GZ997_11525, partial [Actinomyces sp. 565]|nr:hypothetical protein [Actinomyces sp. 565]